MATKAITTRSLDTEVRRARETGKASFLWDTEVKGFGARVSLTGNVSWLLQVWSGGKRYEDGGRARRVVFEADGIDAARSKAAQMKASDVDPVSQKQERKAKQREALAATKLKAAWELYVARKGKADSSHWLWAKAKVEGTVFEALGASTPVVSITKADIIGVIDKIEAQHPISARYTFAVLRPFFKWCVSRQYIAISPMDSLVAPSLPKARDRILTDDELKAFWQATGSMFLWGPFYRLLLLTAQRREEVAGMCWAEIDLEQYTWTIPGSRTKNGKAHTVHLSPRAVSILTELPRLNSQYVFTTTLAAPISGYGKAKDRLDTLSEIKDWVVHDLRRTAASGMAKLGFQPHIIERVLNHVSGAQGGLVAVYQRYEYLEERKRAIEAWGTYVESLVSETPKASNVVSISKIAS